MDLVLTEEQRMLQRAARDLVASRSSLKRVRALRDAREELAFSRELWGEMARLGWLDAELPARLTGVVLEELGRGLVPEPVLPCVVLAGGLLALGGSDAQKREHLPAVAAGERLLAVAYQEARSRRRRIRAPGREAAGDGRRVADWFVVSARTAKWVGRSSPGTPSPSSRRRLLGVSR
jgi:alkylation response protein AidB-like acyl-CoA dehydrogenase